MKMSELIKKTGMSREMIHYFSREGMLPTVEKKSRNQATYTQKHVERILLIKKLRENHYLPIPMIKEIIKHESNLYLPDEELLDIKSNYFKSTDHLMPEKIVGEDEFLKYSGISRERLSDFEEYKIITFDESDGQKIYSHDSVKIGKLIGDMRKRGFSSEQGFRKTAIKEIWEAMMPIVELNLKQLKKNLSNNSFTKEERIRISSTAKELMPLFLYHMAHNYMENELKDFTDIDKDKDL